MSSHFSIPISKPALIGKEKEYVMDCLSSTWISSIGKYIDLFEKSFSEYVGVKHAIACSNGTVALHLALLALGIGSGDEVIVPTLTYVATANAVTYTGAKPVFVDSESATWNMDPSKIDNLVTSRTRAIICVPLYGHPCNMEPILEIAKQYNLTVIEDAAEALGARYMGRLCGSIADISTFSFYGNKIITTGEGGMVVTNDDKLASKIRTFKGQGMDSKKRYWFTSIGYNYRMTNIQAAIGLAQLENIDKFISKRRKIAAWYKENLQGIPGISLPTEKDYAKHCYWLYSILIEEAYGERRGEVATRMAENGVETRPVFYPMHIMPVYKEMDSGDLSTAASISAKGLSLPTYYDLAEKDVEFVSTLLKKIKNRV